MRVEKITRRASS